MTSRHYEGALRRFYFEGLCLRPSGKRSYERGVEQYYPYGEEMTPTIQDRQKFATYYRDGTTVLDYAQNRNYSNILARFLSPDPYRNSAGPADPGSWNRYAYAGNDPVNFNDQTGLNADPCADPTDSPCIGTKWAYFNVSFFTPIWTGEYYIGGMVDSSFVLPPGSGGGVTPDCNKFGSSGRAAGLQL